MSLEAEVRKYLEVHLFFAADLNSRIKVVIDLYLIR